MTKTFKEAIAGIRTAIYGKEVREDIAQMGEYVEQFASTATTKASEAASSASAAKSSESAAAASQSAAKTSETNAASSASTAAGKATAASDSATAAKTSETNAATSASTASSKATAAATSASAAATSQSAAKASETNAASSATASANSATASASSQKAAKTSETNAATSASAAAASQTAAKTSETNASGSATAAANSQKAASASETNAAASASAASTSATAAANSQKAASTSETNAKSSASAASTSETNAKTSETNAKSSATAASASANAASSSATAAANSASSVKTSEANASSSATAAAKSASEAASSASAAAKSAEEAKAAAATDTTLTVSGSPADSAVVGEALGNIYTKAESEANFLQRRGRVPNSNANEATNEGIYEYSGAVTNFYVVDGEQTYGRLLVFNNKVTGESGVAQTWIWQIALVTYPKQVWIRSRINTEDWSAWRRFMDNVDYNVLDAAIKEMQSVATGHATTLDSHTTMLTNANNSINALNLSVGQLFDYQTKEYSWTAIAKGATWSRICLVAAQSNIIGSSFILNVAATRNSVVYNETFAISVNHSGRASIVKLSTAKYSSIQLRCTVDASGNAYVELYDNAQSMTSSSTQNVTCRLIAMRCGTVTPYTAFTDGTTLASGYSVGASMTTNSYSLQSSDGIAEAASVPWSGVTGRPELYTKSEVDALIERMKYMDGKLVYTASVNIAKNSGTGSNSTITVGSNVDYIIVTAPGHVAMYVYTSNNYSATSTPVDGTKVARGCTAIAQVYNQSYSSSTITEAIPDGMSTVTFGSDGTVTFTRHTGYATTCYVNVEGYQYV